MESLRGKPQGRGWDPTLKGPLSLGGSPISGETGSCHDFPFRVPTLRPRGAACKYSSVQAPL